MSDEQKLSAVEQVEPEHTALTEAIITMMTAQVDLLAKLVTSTSDEELNAAIEEWGVGQGRSKPWYVARWSSTVRPQLLREQRRRETEHGAIG